MAFGHRQEDVLNYTIPQALKHTKFAYRIEGMRRLWFISDLGALFGGKKGDMAKHVKGIQELIGDEK